MSDQLLVVGLHGEAVAELRQGEGGRLSLTYLPQAKQALSLSLPLQAEAHGHGPCEAYFGGLLPESEAARVAIAWHHGANARNPFSLLKAIGRECAGAVALVGPDEALPPTQAPTRTPRPWAAEALRQHILDLPRKPLFLGEGGLRLSLAGAQDKAAICLAADGRPALPAPGAPTTHILKPAHDRLPGTVSNEFLCLSLAQDLGFPVPHIERRVVLGLPYFLIARYDRATLPDGAVRRIHQEDFCQALGVPSALKYEADGGPGLPACFALAARFARPAQARLQLLRRVLFNCLVGNADAHAKNFSLLHEGAGPPSLSPLYDVLCTHLRPDLSPKLAMKVGGHCRLSEVQPRHWQRFAESCSLSPPGASSDEELEEGGLQAAIARRLPMTSEKDQESLIFLQSHAQKEGNPPQRKKITEKPKARLAKKPIKESGAYLDLRASV